MIENFINSAYSGFDALISIAGWVFGFVFVPLCAVFIAMLVLFLFFSVIELFLNIVGNIKWRKK